MPTQHELEGKNLEVCTSYATNGFLAEWFQCGLSWTRAELLAFITGQAQVCKLQPMQTSRMNKFHARLHPKKKEVQSGLVRVCRKNSCPARSSQEKVKIRPDPSLMNENWPSFVSWSKIGFWARPFPAQTSNASLQTFYQPKGGRLHPPSHIHH